MSVLPELRAQVLAAAARPPRRRPRAEWIVGAVVVAAAAAVVFLALRHAPAPAPAREDPHAQQLRLFGVLRRAPTAADRAVQIDRMPRSSRPGDVRALAARGYRNMPVIVYTLRISRPPLKAPAALTRRNLLCVQYPDVDGSGSACWTTADILAGRGTASLGPHVYGLVPDGVAIVQLTDPAGETYKAPVRENFFTFLETGPNAPRRGAGYSQDPRVKVTWLDARGRRVGP